MTEQFKEAHCDPENLVGKLGAGGVKLMTHK